MKRVLYIWHWVYLFVIHYFWCFHNNLIFFFFPGTYCKVHLSTAALSYNGQGEHLLPWQNVPFFPWLGVLYGKMISFIARGTEIIDVKLTKDFSSNWPYGLERKVLLFSFVFQSRCAGSLTFGFRDTVISPLVIATIIIIAFIVLF